MSAVGIREKYGGSRVSFGEVPLLPQEYPHSAIDLIQLVLK